MGVGAGSYGLCLKKGNPIAQNNFQSGRELGDAQRGNIFERIRDDPISVAKADSTEHCKSLHGGFALQPAWLFRACAEALIDSP